MELNEEEKRRIIHELNLKIGCDMTELRIVYDLENLLIHKRDRIKSCLSVVNNQVPSKLLSAIYKAEKTSKKVESLKEKSEKLKMQMQQFLDTTGPLRNELNDRFAAICKYEGILLYLKSFERVHDLSTQLKQCTDDEQAVLLYRELKEMCAKYLKGHQASYIKESTHYWHNILKDNFSKQYEDVLKLLKWPFNTAPDHSSMPNEVLSKFSSITRYLLLIEEPKETVTGSVSCDFSQDQEPCLPVRLLLRPLKNRFTFHFTGPRQTARIDRPEWFLTQTLKWIKDHQSFISKNVQPVANKLRMNNIKAEDEFNAGVISLAAERLHAVLGLYNAQNLKLDRDPDSNFAHAVDEALGYHKELVEFTGKENNAVLSVLTKAETFVKWLAIEKRYALAKMEEMLDSDQWMEVVTTGSVAEPVAGWVPKGADWLTVILKNLEHRYTLLPQPGHRLQFLELQLELIEEWRVRLTQLLSAAVNSLSEDSFIAADGSPHPLTAVINSAHHTRNVLLQGAHSLHYLQLHYYRRQFQHFTQMQHHSDMETGETMAGAKATEGSAEGDIDETMSLKEVEAKARRLALNEISRKSSVITISGDTPQQETIQLFVDLPTTELPAVDTVEDEDESGVFGEAPALFAHLRDAGLTALADHILLEFKATLWDYKRLKWHAMTVVEEKALCVSASLCRPLSGLCARLHAAQAKLAPALTANLRTHLAAEVDQYVFEEVVLGSWWSTGGMVQLTHDVKRNLVPAFAPPNKVATNLNLLPKLLEACKILNLDYDEACRMRTTLAAGDTPDGKTGMILRKISPTDALTILNQRVDLTDEAPPSVLEMF